MDPYIAWLNTFEDVDAASIAQLSDGRILALIASKILPGNTTEGTSPAGTFEHILEGCQGQFNRSFTPLFSSERAASGDESEIKKIINLLLLMAVQSEEKGVFIQGITSLANDVQYELMSAIESLNSQLSDLGINCMSPVKSVPGSPAFAACMSPMMVSRSRRTSMDNGLHGTHSRIPTLRNGQQQENNQAETRHLRERLQKAEDELHDALVMHDTVVEELQGKNRDLESLRFRVREAEAAVERVKVLEEELEETRAVESKYRKVDARLKQVSAELAATKTEAADLRGLQLEFTALKNTHQASTERMSSLDARVKELRVTVKSAELKYAEAHASNTRKQNEIERLSQSRTQMQELVTQLKTENSALRRDNAATVESGATLGFSSVNEVEFKKQRETIQQLEEQVCELQASKAMAQATHTAAMEALQQELEDTHDVRAALEKRFTADISARDARVLELENMLASNDGDASRFATDAQLARDEASKAAAYAESLEDEVARLRAKLAKAFHDMAHKPAASYSKDYEHQRSNKPDSHAPASHTRPETAPPAWSQGGGPVGGLDYLTDEARMAEMARRNRQRPPHLRSQYAIEMQLVDQPRKDTGTAPTQAASGGFVTTTGPAPTNTDADVAKAAIATRPWAPQAIETTRPQEPVARTASSPLARTAATSPPATAAPPPTAFMLTFSPMGKSAPPQRRPHVASSLGSGAGASTQARTNTNGTDLSVPGTKQSKVAQLQRQEDNAILLRRFSNAGQAFDVAVDATAAPAAKKKYSTPPRLRQQKEAHAARKREREEAAAAKKAKEAAELKKKSTFRATIQPKKTTKLSSKPTTGNKTTTLKGARGAKKHAAAATTGPADNTHAEPSVSTPTKTAADRDENARPARKLPTPPKTTGAGLGAPLRVTTAVSPKIKVFEDTVDPGATFVSRPSMAQALPGTPTASAPGNSSHVHSSGGSSKDSPCRPYSPVLNSTTKEPFKQKRTPFGNMENHINPLVDYGSPAGW
eukprot:m.639809 g.639809  ORF g.639809 m.639809 type:complete len:997 (+) comp22618_c0_seq1:93-3083(+)